MSAQEHQFDDIDLLLRGSLQQQECDEATYDHVWRDLRERIEHQRQTEQAALAQTARPSSYQHIGWQVRCQWHAIELTLSLSISPIR